jgi:hypothetical protein
MSVEEVTMYRVICDRCGQADDSDYYAWMDDSQALDVARESEWLIRDDGQWCPGCTTWDEEADEEVPLALEDKPERSTP